ncbi:UDP-N-acetylglucosamine acyltransferase [Catellatospora sp. NPDC049609]|uniref:UDP-N-acetylglucosamine acyltransferase n=1 Tax=Catellatospora sp. NPDC049609 TaxID=3155505 RepID=UPI003445F9B3
MSAGTSSDNRIHPTAFIGPGVTLGTGNVIGPFAVLLGPLVIGDDNWIGPHACLGTPGEIKGNEHGAAWDAPNEGPGIVIGSRNTLREYVAVHQGSHNPTTIGDDCFIMNKSSIPHDARLENHVTMAPSVLIGGHVWVGEGATLGINTVVHQRRVIGPGAMIGMGSVATRDVPPYAMAFGNPTRVRGVNKVGMSRRGVAPDAVQELAELYAKEDFEPQELPEALTAAFTWFRETLATER